jgi:putative ABC transport system substrate-binding protein
VAWFSEGTRAKHREFLETFVEGMRALGQIDARTFSIEYYWRGETIKSYRWIASDIVDAKPDVIVATCELTAGAAKKATNSIPIVVTLTSDPVAFGLAASLARPGGNLTGLSGNVVEVHGKRLEMLSEIVPGLRRVALLRPAGWPQSDAENAAIGEAARRLGLTIGSVEVDDSGDLERPKRAIEAMKAQAVLDMAALSVNVPELQALANLPTRAGIPGMFYISELVDAGGLISYGPNVRDGFRRAARFVDRIAKGAKVADLPIEQPDRFELVVNQRTARQLGIALPQSLLLRADRVIQ